VAWYYNVWLMLFLLFFVLGPFGLPLIWKHPTLPRGAKASLSVVVLVYTAWLLQVTWRTAQVVLEHFNTLGSSVGF
jgi:hypothetical protein